MITQLSVCSAVECHLNLVLIMDSSGSVGYQDYQLELSFVKTLLEIVSYSSVSRVLLLTLPFIHDSTTTISFVLDKSVNYNIDQE